MEVVVGDRRRLRTGVPAGTAAYGDLVE